MLRTALDDQTLRIYSKLKGFVRGSLNARGLNRLSSEATLFTFCFHNFILGVSNDFVDCVIVAALTLRRLNTRTPNDQRVAKYNDSFRPVSPLGIPPERGLALNMKRSVRPSMTGFGPPLQHAFKVVMQIRNPLSYRKDKMKAFGL